MLDTQAGLAGNVSVLFLLCQLELQSWGQRYALTFFFFPSCWLSAVTVASPLFVTSLLQTPHLRPWTSHPLLSR